MIIYTRNFNCLDLIGLKTYHIDLVILILIRDGDFNLKKKYGFWKSVRSNSDSHWASYKIAILSNFDVFYRLVIIVVLM